MNIPKVLLNAPVGVVKYLTPKNLNLIDPTNKLGLALTYDILKYLKNSKVHKFIAQPDRSLILYPESAKYHAKQQNHSVQTQSSNFVITDEMKKQLSNNEFGFDMIVGYNQHFSQFKNNISRDDVFREVQQFEGYQCLTVTKLFQLNNYTQQYIYTCDEQIVQQIHEENKKLDEHARKKVIFNVQNNIQQFTKYIKEDNVKLIVNFPVFQAEYELAVNFCKVITKNLEQISYKKIFLRNAKYRNDIGVINNICQQQCCTDAKLAYIQHLFNTNELLAYIYATIHNIGQIVYLIEQKE